MTRKKTQKKNKKKERELRSVLAANFRTSLAEAGSVEKNLAISTSTSTPTSLTNFFLIFLISRIFIMIVRDGFIFNLLVLVCDSLRQSLGLLFLFFDISCVITFILTFLLPE